MTPKDDILHFGKLLASIVYCLSAGLIGSAATVGAVNTWYPTIIKPSFSPPNWVFAPVWTVLYILMGAALFLVWDTGLRKQKTRVAFWLFILHLGVNALWSIVFFGLHNIGGGLAVILILLGFILVLYHKFYAISKWSAYLLVPYIVWVGFATILNASLLWLNFRR